MNPGDIVSISGGDPDIVGIVISTDIMVGWYENTGTTAPLVKCLVLWNRDIPTWYWGSGLVRELSSNLLKVVDETR